MTGHWTNFNQIISLGFAIFLASGASMAVAEETAAKPRRGVRREQKETEGTEAKGRFEADTILKSQYQLDGQNLEVDPD